MLDQLLQKVKDTIWNDDSNMYHPNSDRGGLIGQIESLFSNHQAQYGNQGNGQFGNVQPASQDRYGDPANQGNPQFNNVQPASQDRYGDPADQERRR